MTRFHFAELNFARDEAKRLQTILKDDANTEIPLTVCQDILARSAGYRDWAELAAVTRRGGQSPSPSSTLVLRPDILENLTALPVEAATEISSIFSTRKPSNYSLWCEDLLSRLRQSLFWPDASLSRPDIMLSRLFAKHRDPITGRLEIVRTVADGLDRPGVIAAERLLVLTNGLSVAESYMTNDDMFRCSVHAHDNTSAFPEIPVSPKMASMPQSSLDDMDIDYDSIAEMLYRHGMISSHVEGERDFLPGIMAMMRAICDAGACELTFSYDDWLRQDVSIVLGDNKIVFQAIGPDRSLVSFLGETSATDLLRGAANTLPNISNRLYRSGDLSHGQDVQETGVPGATVILYGDEDMCRSLCEALIEQRSSVNRCRKIQPHWGLEVVMVDPNSSLDPRRFGRTDWAIFMAKAQTFTDAMAALDEIEIDEYAKNKIRALEIGRDATGRFSVLLDTNVSEMVTSGTRTRRPPKQGMRSLNAHWNRRITTESSTVLESAIACQASVLTELQKPEDDIDVVGWLTMRFSAQVGDRDRNVSVLTDGFSSSAGIDGDVVLGQIKSGEWERLLAPGSRFTGVWMNGQNFPSVCPHCALSEQHAWLTKRQKAYVEANFTDAERSTLRYCNPEGCQECHGTGLLPKDEEWIALVIYASPAICVIDFRSDLRRHVMAGRISPLLEMEFADEKSSHETQELPAAIRDRFRVGVTA